VAAETAAVGEVIAQQGAAMVIRDQGLVPLALGDRVHLDDIVRTGPDGRLLIAFPDGLRLAIGSGTEVAIRSYRTGRPQGGLEVVLGLLQGIMRLIGGESTQPRLIEVDTRTAVASVRSTEWLIESTVRGTGVLAIVGEVTVLALAGGQVRLRPGEGTDVPPGGSPKAPARWGEARRRDAIARTTI
jgi:hypothetical protein